MSLRVREEESELKKTRVRIEKWKWPKYWSRPCVYRQWAESSLAELSRAVVCWFPGAECVRLNSRSIDDSGCRWLNPLPGCLRAWTRGAGAGDQPLVGGAACNTWKISLDEFLFSSLSFLLTALWPKASGRRLSVCSVPPSYRIKTTSTPTLCYKPAPDDESSDYTHKKNTDGGLWIFNS